MLYQREATIISGGSRAIAMLIEEADFKSSSVLVTENKRQKSLLNFDQLWGAAPKHSAPLKPIKGLGTAGVIIEEDSQDEAEETSRKRAEFSNEGDDRTDS